MAEQEKTARPLPQKVGVCEFRSNFLDVMWQVRQGATFHVMSRNSVAAVAAPPLPSMRRQPGTLRGRISMAPDFDALPDEFLAAMEAEF